MRVLTILNDSNISGRFFVYYQLQNGCHIIKLVDVILYYFQILIASMLALNPRLCSQFTL